MQMVGRCGIVAQITANAVCMVDADDHVHGEWW